MASETTFVFPDAPCMESDDSNDEAEVLYDASKEATQQKVPAKSQSIGGGASIENKDEKKADTEIDTEKANATAEALVVLREKREMLIKRRALVYQLMATSVIVGLHGISFLPYFFNNALMNINVLNLQTLTLFVVLGAYCLSCLFTPSVLYRVQIRWTMACGCIIAGIFSVVRFFPSVYTLLPCGLLFGLSLGPFYSAAGRNIARLASMFEGYEGATYAQTVSTFTAISGACVSFSVLWASLLHVLLFNVFGGPVYDPKAYILPDVDCGFNYMWNFFDDYGQRNGMAPELRSTLDVQLVSCLICTLGGVIFCFTALKDIAFPKGGQHELVSKAKVTEEVKEVSKQVRDANLLLLFPICMSGGFLETFCYTIYAQAFLYCSVGPDELYFGTLLMSTMALITCCLMGYVTRHVSRIILMSVAYACAITLLIVLVFVSDMLPALYYFIAVVLGCALGMITTQIHALPKVEYGENVEVAQAVLHFAKSLAYLTTFVLMRYHGYNSTLSSCVIGTCVIALLCYIILELRLRAIGSEQSSAPRGGHYLLLNDESQFIGWLDSKGGKKGGKKWVEKQHLVSDADDEDEKN